MSSETLNPKFFQVPISAFILSLLMHFGLALLFLIYTQVGEMGFSLFKTREPIKEVYQNFVQVDVVALPDQLISQPSAVDSSLPVVDKAQLSKQETIKEPVAEKKVDPAATALKKSELEMSERASKEKLEKQRKAEQEKALKNLQAEAKREQALKALTDQKNKSGKIGREKISGNVLSKGTSTAGVVGKGGDIWGARIRQAIEAKLNFFPWQQKRKDLKPVIRLEVFPNGNLKSLRIEKASVDPTFDSALLQAVQQAQPLPLPEDLTLLNVPLVIEYKP